MKSGEGIRLANQTETRIGLGRRWTRSVLRTSELMALRSSRVALTVFQSIMLVGGVTLSIQTVPILPKNSVWEASHSGVPGKRGGMNGLQMALPVDVWRLARI